jgi:O-acetyl-ADP-ribose deacetylase (regulator of RNase III)
VRLGDQGGNLRPSILFMVPIDLPDAPSLTAPDPIWGEGNEEASLRSAVRESLDRASELGATSIALPAISTGIFGYPKREGTAAIFEEARSWLDGQPDSSLKTVRFTAFDEPTAELFADAIRVLATFMPKSGIWPCFPPS